MVDHTFAEKFLAYLLQLTVSYILSVPICSNNAKVLYITKITFLWVTMAKIEENRKAHVFELSQSQKDAFTEVCHIASSHAVTALAELTGTAFEIDVPSVMVVPIKDVKRRLKPEQLAAGILIRLEGKFSGYIHICFPERTAFQIVDILLCRMPGETKSLETETEQSALMETGNILASAFCDTVADYLKLDLMPSPPSFAFDMMGALIDSPIVAIAQAHETEHILLFKYAFHGKGDGIHGQMFLFPHPDGLKEVLSSLERVKSDKN